MMKKRSEVRVAAVAKRDASFCSQIEETRRCRVIELSLGMASCTGAFASS